MLLRAININKTYGDTGSPLHVLKGINVEVNEGEVLSIVGPSGAGKSTLLHILGGLDLPTDGKVMMGEQDIYSLNDRQRSQLRNEKVGFVFQFYHLLPEFTAIENIVMPAMIKANSRKVKDFEFRAKELLQMVGLENRCQHKPSQLSGGEQQRVAIARALINDPGLILCDEPTGNLDSESGQTIIDLLLALNKKNNQTIVLVTHDTAIAEKSHRIIRIRDGIIE